LLELEGDYGVADLYRFLSGYTLPRDPGSEYEYSNLARGCWATCSRAAPERTRKMKITNAE
jgi:hypothetical protein